MFFVYIDHVFELFDHVCCIIVYVCMLHYYYYYYLLGASCVGFLVSCIVYASSVGLIYQIGMCMLTLARGG
jgi:hypothetical protein